MHYLKSIGPFLCISTILLSIVFQGFSISSNIWLSIWSNDNDNNTLTHKKEITSKRNLYLSVYGLLGFGQGKFEFLAVNYYFFFLQMIF